LRQNIGNSNAGLHREVAPRAQENRRLRDFSRAPPGALAAVCPICPGVARASDSSPAGRLQYQRQGGAIAAVLRRVDTGRLSGRLEIRKTCGISIGSAPFVPPVIRAAALLRRSFQVEFGRRSEKPTGSTSMGGIAAKLSGDPGANSVAVAHSERRPAPPADLRKRSGSRNSRARSVLTDRLVWSGIIPTQATSKCGMRFAGNSSRKDSRPAVRPANGEAAK